MCNQSRPPSGIGWPKALVLVVMMLSLGPIVGAIGKWLLLDEATPIASEVQANNKLHQQRLVFANAVPGTTVYVVTLTPNVTCVVIEDKGGHWGSIDC